jgi:hypothetical protein
MPHSMAPHAVSSLSHVHPHLRQACNAIGVSCALINLKAKEQCPEVFRHIELLRLSLSELREKFETIMAAEGLTFTDIESVNPAFYFTAEFPDDYCSIRDVEIRSAAGKKYRYVVDYMGNTRIDRAHSCGALCTPVIRTVERKRFHPKVSSCFRDLHAYSGLSSFTGFVFLCWDQPAKR